MGWWDDLLQRGKKKATQETGKAVAKQAMRAAAAAVEGLADDVLGYAEGELDEAKARRGERESLVSHLTQDEPAPEQEVSEPEAPEEPGAEEDPQAEADAREAEREAREARARAELEALKAGHRASPAPPEPVPEESEVPVDPYAGRPPAVRARLEREERARRELEELKRQMAGGDDDAPVKKTL